MGTGPAAIVAVNMHRTFKNLKFTLMVGIGGGVPGPKKDVRLGDVVVSCPDGDYNGIVQYDYGTLRGSNNITRKDWFQPPPNKVLTAVSLLRSYHLRPKNPINNMPEILKELGEDYEYPDEVETPDQLYEADFEHHKDEETCATCGSQALVQRKPRRVPQQAVVHHGTIASGNLVIKNAIERDRIDQRYDKMIYCFEMEAAGLIINYPSLTVRGISDYSDSHKNDEWRNRAIAVSSAYAKELLSVIEPYNVEVTMPMPPWILLRNGVL